MAPVLKGNHDLLARVGTKILFLTRLQEPFAGLVPISSMKKHLESFPPPMTVCCGRRLERLENPYLSKEVPLPLHVDPAVPLHTGIRYLHYLTRFPAHTVWHCSMRMDTNFLPKISTEEL